MNSKIPAFTSNSKDLHSAMESLVEALFHNGIDLSFAQKELESRYICRILDQHQGNVTRSAQAMGLHRNTLSKRIRELDIQWGPR